MNGNTYFSHNSASDGGGEGGQAGIPLFLPGNDGGQ